ncbi:MAG: hypothetical protein WBH44_06290 [Proteocatella sp.]
MREFLNWMKEEESGQGMVEYGIVVALVVAVAVLVLKTNGTLGNAVTNLFTTLGTKITNALT